MLVSLLIFFGPSFSFPSPFLPSLLGLLETEVDSPLSPPLPPSSSAAQAASSPSSSSSAATILVLGRVNDTAQRCNRARGESEVGGGGGMVFFSFPSSSRKERSLLQPHYLWSGRGRAAAEDWKVGEGGGGGRCAAEKGGGEVGVGLGRRRPPPILPVSFALAS